jgi:hypothetical protein
LEVMMTIGGCAALTVPSSGIVTWKSDSNFEQIGLERLVGAVELVDQQHRRALDMLGSSACEQRPLDQEALVEDVGERVRSRSCTPCRLGEPDLDHLARVVPLVDRRRDVEALVALQPDQRAPEGRRPAPWRSRSCRRRPRLRRTAAGRA